MANNIRDNRPDFPEPLENLWFQYTLAEGPDPDLPVARAIKIAVTLEVFRIEVPEDEDDPAACWTWRAVDASGAIVARSSYRWEDPNATIHYLKSLFTAAQVNLCLGPQ